MSKEVKISEELEKEAETLYELGVDSRDIEFIMHSRIKNKNI
ncbi:MAG TPA: hypothetical protein VJ208_01555 [Candidatus Nanoarchaeia archaeon]|nr:hypothetical protein [Candidatus Nanoarchaeia archaeon]